MPFVKHIDGRGGVDGVDGMEKRRKTLRRRATWLNDCMARANGAIHLQVRLPYLKFAESSADDGKWAYLEMPFVERFDGRCGMDDLDGMEKRRSAFHGRARGSTITWRGPVALFVCEFGGPLEVCQEIHW